MRKPLMLLRPLLGLVASALVFTTAFADTIEEPDTKTAFPRVVSVEVLGQERLLEATGVGLREATFLKVNVYAICSYAEASATLGDDHARGLINADVAKRLHMKFVRDVEVKKVTDAFRDGIKKNFKKDEMPFSDDLETFITYFEEDIVVGDDMVLTSIPGQGIVVDYKGATKSLDNPALAKALWTIWFGKKPVSKSMKKGMLAELK
ncbi:MAG: hypothetical protein HKN21_17690 [Candidatus Eisenbacteria bacterium]|uniref:Chalcone isomerase domain-containing protein n=1 Tax=Eiseniibacteriota bacterium TaxID=2212470 RepID=A0A7Y2H3X1_UNCEI|nr:hypothetical protein [Candidatus Eisenbacteria bacterium]